MAKLYNGELSREISSQTDIADVIGESIRLTRKGNKYWGLCPFHGEKTPSFCVDRDRQMFYCFGCHIGGDVYTFLMKSQGFSFPQAMERLAERAGIQLPKNEEPETVNEHHQLLRLHQVTADYYRNVFLSAKGKKARDYLQQRGLEQAIGEKFYLGYAGEEWDGLTNHLQRQGFSAELMLKSGLIRRSPTKNSLYDFFRGRVIFPIMQYAGEYIAFGGRTMLADQQPKYLNSPETLIFSKRKSLYGILQAREAIRKENTVFLVEGYMDLVKMHQYNLTNTVASLGTAFTEEQAALLHRYAERAIVVYDGDAAGQRQTWRALDILQQEGMNAYALTLPEGMDPDDFLSNHGIKGFAEQQKTNLQSALDFKLKELLASSEKMDSKRKSEIIKQLYPGWQKLKSEVEKEEYIGTLAVKLFLAENTVNKEMARLTAEAKSNQGKRDNSSSSGDHNTKDQYTVVDRVMAYILRNETAFVRVKKEIGLEVFVDESYRKLLQLYDANLTQHTQLNPLELREKIIESGLTDIWAKLMMLEMNKEDKAYEVYVSDFIAEVKNRQHVKKWEALVQEFSAYSQGDFDKIARLLYKFNRQLLVTREGGIK